MQTRKQTQKRQTRLSFTPLPSSSPSAKTYPEGIQNRLVNVRYETPFKGRKKMEEAEPKTPAQAGGEGRHDPILLDSSQDTDLGQGMPKSVQTVQHEPALPTPVASSQQKEQLIDQDEDLATPGSPMTVVGVENTNLVPESPSPMQAAQIETALSTPAASSHMNDQDLDHDGDFGMAESPIAVVDITSAPTTPISSYGLDAASSDEDAPAPTTPVRSDALDDPSSDDGATPAPTTSVKTHGADAARPNEELIETSDEEAIVPRIRTRRPKAVWESDSEDESDVLPPTRRRAIGRDVQQISRAQGLKDVQIKSPARRRSTRGENAQQSSPTQSLREVQTTPHRQTRSAAKQTSKEMSRSRKKTLTPQRSREVRSVMSSGIGEAESSDDEDLTVPGGRPKPKRVHRLQHSSDEEILFVISDSEDSDIQVSPAKRRKITPRKIQSLSPAKRGSNSPMELSRRNSRQEEEDLAEDLADLQDTIVKESRTRRPSRNVNKQAQKEALKQIRRKHQEKAGEAVSEDEDDSDPDGTSDGDGDEGFEHENVSESQAYAGNLDEYEADFIDNTEEGATEHRPLPLELSNYRIRKPKDLFKYVVDWLVHNKLNPAFERHDEKYRIAFDRLNQEAEGLAGQSTSSAWGPHPAGIKFTKALKARPEIRIKNYDHRVIGKDCDACNRSKHPASFEIVFDGPCYDKHTLEHKGAEDTSFDEDDPSADVVGPEVTFYVGSTCKANAEKVHNLIHWKYRVNGWIMDHLEAKDEFTNAQILKRSSWSKKKLNRKANEIVDEMEDEGVIEGLYQHLKLSINEARAQQPDRFAHYND